MNTFPNLIGVSGKIGSGKDTVTKMLQYLTYIDFDAYERLNIDKSQVKLSEYYLDSINNVLRKPKYINKKYADKLKDFICSITGCTREQLEDEDFKNRMVGGNWYKWYVKYADNNDIIHRRYFSYEEDYNIFLEVNSIIPIKHYKKWLTYRDLMQLVGTDACRNIVHQGIWVMALFADYEINSKWIVSDVRFPDEAKAIKKRDGIVIRVNSKYIDRKNKIPRSNNFKTRHYSEVALDKYDRFDYIINNDDDLEFLIKQLVDIYKEYRYGKN